ncbi:MAG: DUF892 family protein [Bacteroidota bacterium]
MRKIHDLKDLLIEKVRELYDGEKQQIKVLPALIERIQAEDLRAIMVQHVMDTEDQLLRLERVFNRLYEEPTSKTNMVMKSLLKEAKDLQTRSADQQEVLDAGLISSMQHIKHYEIAGYGAVANYANLLDEEVIASLLHESLEEEKSADERLRDLAETRINLSAKSVYQ